MRAENAVEFSHGMPIEADTNKSVKVDWFYRFLRTHFFEIFYNCTYTYFLFEMNKSFMLKSFTFRN